MKLEAMSESLVETCIDWTVWTSFVFQFKAFLGSLLLNVNHFVLLKFVVTFTVLSTHNQ